MLAAGGRRRSLWEQLVTRLLFIKRLSGACLGWMLLAGAACCARAAEPQRVLMVFKEGSQVPANVLIEQAVRAKLGPHGAHEVEIFTEYLDASRFGSVNHHALFRDYLREKYRHLRPNVILTTMGFELAGLFPRELLSDIPAVFILPHPSPSFSPGPSRGTNITAQVACLDCRGTLNLVFRLQPGIRRMVVIGGVGASDRGALQEVQTAHSLFTNRADFEFWTHLPLAELQAAVSRLPRDTAVLYTPLFQDVSGRTFVPAEALELILEHASVPVYVLVDSQLGRGAVGGSLLSYERLGASAGETARRILDGTPVAHLPVTVQTNGTPMFDWRALRRWGMEEARLPPGSVIRFRQPTPWELYRWWIIGGVVFCGVEAALIVGLLLNRARRRQGEAEAALIAEISSKFVNLPPSEVDREIQEAQRRICQRLGIEASALWQWSRETPPSLTQTHLYRAQEGPPPERMSAADYFPWCQQELLAGRIIRVSSPNDLPAEAARDRESWVHFGMKASLTIPLAVGGGPPVGALSFNTREERRWPDALVARLQLVAQVFANALARERADQAFRSSEARLAAGADLAGLGHYEVDFAEPACFVDERFQSICGVPAGHRPGLQSLEFWMQHLHPDDRPRVLAERQKLHDGSVERLSIEYRYLHPARGLRWIHHVARVALRSAAGRAVRTFGVVRDITEAKQAEEAARTLSGRLIHAQEQERARLARELHDDITQRLARLAIDIGRCELGTSEAPPAQTAREVRMGLVQLSEDVHALSYRLHPSILEDLGLVAALKAESERFTRQQSVPVQVNLRDLPDPIPRDTALCLFRVAQEALRNVARHAQARTVEISLRSLDGGLQLAVQDDGMGFDPARDRSRPSLGLSSMRERVHLLGGELDLESTPGQGASVVAWVPLKESPKAEG